MDVALAAPRLLVYAAGGGLVLGALPLFWILRRALGRLGGRRGSSVGLSRYLFALALSALLLGVGVGASGLVVALRGYQAFTARTRVAELQCIELGPGKLRLYYVPVDDKGTRGASETYDLDGDEWSVGGDVVRFRPWLTALGLATVHKVTRVEGRWTRAADANAHHATAFDREGGTGELWLTLYRDGARGPLHYLVDGVHGQSVSQLPDRLALFDLFITPSGYVLDKRGG